MFGWVMEECELGNRQLASGVRWLRNRGVRKYQGANSEVVLWGMRPEVKLSSIMVIIWSFWQLQKFCLIHELLWCDDKGKVVRGILIPLARRRRSWRESRLRVGPE